MATKKASHRPAAKKGTKKPVSYVAFTHKPAKKKTTGKKPVANVAFGYKPSKKK